MNIYEIATPIFISLALILLSLTSVGLTYWISRLTDRVSVLEALVIQLLAEKHLISSHSFIQNVREQTGSGGNNGVIMKLVE